MGTGQGIVAVLPVWEGNRWSKVATATRNRLCGSMAQGIGTSTLLYRSMTPFIMRLYTDIANGQPQLSLLPSVGWEVSTVQSAVMLCGWGVKTGWLIPFVDKRMGGR